MILKTKRLILRPPKASDWKDLVEGCNTLETSKFLEAVPYPYKKKDAKSWIKVCKGRWRRKKKDNYNFFIELKSEKKMIGVMSINQVDRKSRVCRTGSWINPNYRRKGYITEAKVAVNDFAFDKLKMRKMETCAFALNKASNLTQKGLGYKHEGRRIKSKYCLATGKIHDMSLYGLLKEDWKKVRGKVIKKLRKK